MLTNNYLKLRKGLDKVIDPKRVITNPLQLLAYGTDASFYRLIPKLVVRVHSEKEAIEVIRQTSKLGISVTCKCRKQ